MSNLLVQGLRGKGIKRVSDSVDGTPYKRQTAFEGAVTIDLVSSDDDDEEEDWLDEVADGREVIVMDGPSSLSFSDLSSAEANVSSNYSASSSCTSSSSSLLFAKMPFPAWILLQKYLLSAPKSFSAVFTTAKALAQCAHNQAWVSLLEIEGAKRGRKDAGSTAARATATHIIARERASPALVYALERLQNVILDVVVQKVLPVFDPRFDPRYAANSMFVLGSFLPSLSTSQDTTLAPQQALGSPTTSTFLSRMRPNHQRDRGTISRKLL
jgi:hypothetical protein